MTDKWQVETFGRDCMGNITGYRVCRRVWRYTGNPYRGDGCNLEYEVAGQYIGNIYAPGSFNEAKREANSVCGKLNAALDSHTESGLFRGTD